MECAGASDVLAEVPCAGPEIPHDRGGEELSVGARGVPGKIGYPAGRRPNFAVTGCRRGRTRVGRVLY